MDKTNFDAVRLICVVLRFQNHMKKIIAAVLALALCAPLCAQVEIIRLKNPSFEGLPHAGGQSNGFNFHQRVTPFGAIPAWTDCGHVGETPPDLHTDTSSFFEVNRFPQDGTTFLGMVVRYNDTWERVSQRLAHPLSKDKCYKLSIYLSKDRNYRSGTKRAAKDKKELFTKPCVLRINGGDGFCSSKQVMSESVPIVHEDWRRYEFILQPSQDWSHIELEAFYETPVLFPYNGNLLLDNISAIEEIKCPQEVPERIVPQPKEEVLANAEVPKKVEPKVRPRPEPKPQTKPKPPVKKQEVVQTPVESKKNKILKDLDRKSLKEGQTIKIDKLYFSADKAIITSTSDDVLDEIYTFLHKYKDIVVEIGGHTNGVPKHNYCDSLSTLRAEAVAGYLTERGINEERIKTKGYGKRQPIASNKSKEGRRRNQRVEIKILSLANSG